MLVMEWDFKDFAWDSNEDHDHQLDQQKEEINDLAALVGSSSGGAASLYSLMDLKLGSSSTTTTAQLVDPKPSSTSSPALFKTKRVTSGIDRHDQKLQVSSSSTTSSCLVDGCKADLSRCREYHRRHRVCELHSKAPIVIIRGQQKRFCQQCSRFHSLVEFDEVKRSCRKRLNGHNQRRRKPKPESFFFTSKNFLSAYQGPRILHFGPPQLCAATNEISMWPLEAKSAADHHCNWLHAIDRQRIPPKSFTGTKRGEKQLTFNQPVAPQAKHAISSDGTTRGIDSSCALCLLSSSHPTQSSVNTTNVVSTSTHSGHEQLHMKSFSQLPSYCSSQDHVENKLLMVRPDPDGLLDTGAQKLPILLE